MEEYIQDDWPKMPDGSLFNGKNLHSLVRNGKSPFDETWDVNLLIKEIEKNLGVEVIDIPLVSNGSNNYVRLFQETETISPRTEIYILQSRDSISKLPTDQTS
jgi:hypothetical protein